MSHDANRVLAYVTKLVLGIPSVVLNVPVR
jgi:hypothetical protein